MINVQCPHCRQVSQVDEFYCGYAVACPICGQQFLMPKAAAAPPPPPPQAQGAPQGIPQFSMSPHAGFSARSRRRSKQPAFPMTPLTIALIGSGIALLVLIFSALMLGPRDSETTPTAGQQLLAIVAMLALIWLGAVIYLLPTLIALHREVRQIGPIVLTNIVFGWLFIGWFIAMAWALSSTRPLQVTYKRDHYER